MRHQVSILGLLCFVSVLCVGCSVSKDKKPGCDEACTVANMSFNELQERFGSNEIPKRFDFATQYVEGVSYDEFKRCINEAVKKKTTAEALGCSTRAHTVCVSQCENDGH